MDPNSINTIAGNYSALITWIIPLVSAFVGAIIGGIITGRYSLRAVTVAHEKDLERQEKADEKRMQGFYRAVLTETETLWIRYQETAGHIVESLTASKALMYYYPITQDYFTIYRGNANLIGCIPDRRLREIIVKTYVEGQALVDSYKMNNEMVARLERLGSLFAETENPIYQQEHALVQSGLVDYAASIQKLHYQLKTDMEKLVGALKDNIRPE